MAAVYATNSYCKKSTLLQKMFFVPLAPPQRAIVAGGAASGRYMEFG
jgi:hypothetical protein